VDDLSAFFFGDPFDPEHAFQARRLPFPRGQAGGDLNRADRDAPG
jgi:hypothetical protein